MTQTRQYLTATINEILRRRPCCPTPSLAWSSSRSRSAASTTRPALALSANAYLLHHDPAIYPEPYAFRPERFLERRAAAPGTYTWIPFGGGRRRCLGASFALLEMKLVLRAVLQRCELRPTSEHPEVSAPAGNHDQSITGSAGDPAWRTRSRTSA